MSLASLLKAIFTRDPRTPYQRGYEMAEAELATASNRGQEEYLLDHLEALADGGFNTTDDDRSFDKGVNDYIDHHRRAVEAMDALRQVSMAVRGSASAPVVTEEEPVAPARIPASRKPRLRRDL